MKLLPDTVTRSWLAASGAALKSLSRAAGMEEDEEGEEARRDRPAPLLAHPGRCFAGADVGAGGSVPAPSQRSLNVSLSFLPTKLLVNIIERHRRHAGSGGSVSGEEAGGRLGRGLGLLPSPKAVNATLGTVSGGRPSVACEFRRVGAMEVVLGNRCCACRARFVRGGISSGSVSK